MLKMKSYVFDILIFDGHLAKEKMLFSKIDMSRRTSPTEFLKLNHEEYRVGQL